MSYVDRFDPAIAEAMSAPERLDAGLPGYLGVRVAEFGPGRLVMSMDARDELKNPFGNLHGGVVAGLVDHVLGAVVYPLMRPGQWAATTEFKLNYLAPVREGPIEAVATVEAMTRRTAVVRAEVSNAGRTVCLAQGTLLIQDPKPEQRP